MTKKDNEINVPIVPVHERALYDADTIFNLGGITTINPKATYTIMKGGHHQNDSAFRFLLNGWEEYTHVITIKGSDIHRLAMNTRASIVEDQLTAIAVAEEIEGTTQYYNFIVASEKISPEEGNKAPTITIEKQLNVGDNKATDIVSYYDPEDDPISDICINVLCKDLKDPLAEEKELRLVFDGTDLGIDNGGSHFTPRQLKWLTFRVPSYESFSDSVEVTVRDVYGNRNSTQAFLTSK